ncbi:MAG: AAA family ATPase [Solirubrobacterales bacterium]|nr:AAA family ATPase [Solirubrobacterales bacterium]
MARRGSIPRPRLAPERLLERRICVCVGSGGVGKTTISAALGLGLAAGGGRVAVVTIDPANRLANALGVAKLGDEPHLVDTGALEIRGELVQGELWAMTLDVKRTFDRLVARLAPDERAREEVLANRIYREISSAVAGSQEVSALARLYELEREGGFDVIVLDTPPSRNALDFLDAPGRLQRFLEGRALGMFLAPAGMTSRLLGRPAGLLFSFFSRATGVDMVAELSVFFRSLGGMLDGVHERAVGVGALLRDPASSTFLIVSSPERAGVDEAIFLAQRLRDAAMERGGLVVNRVHLGGLHGHTVQEVHELLSPELGEALAARVAGNLADFDVLARRDAEGVARLARAIEEPSPVLIPHLDAEVEDLPGLARVAELMLEPRATRQR